MDNRIQKFNQKERAGIRLAWYVVSPRPVKMSAMVRGVVQCTSVWWSSVARSSVVLAATNPSVNSCQPMDQPSWPPMQPPHQSSKCPSQEGQSEKISSKAGSPFQNPLDNPYQPQTPREYPGYKIHPGVKLATLRSSPDNQDHSAQDSVPFPENVFGWRTFKPT